MNVRKHSVIIRIGYMIDFPDGLHVTFGGRLDLYQQPDGDGRFLLLSNET